MHSQIALACSVILTSDQFKNSSSENGGQKTVFPDFAEFGVSMSKLQVYAFVKHLRYLVQYGNYENVLLIQTIIVLN